MDESFPMLPSDEADLDRLLSAFFAGPVVEEEFDRKDLKTVLSFPYSGSGDECSSEFQLPAESTGNGSLEAPEPLVFGTVVTSGSLAGPSLQPQTISSGRETGALNLPENFLTMPASVALHDPSMTLLSLESFMEFEESAGHSTGKPAPNQKKEAKAEKNRKAQKRFRERQKEKASDLETRFLEVSKQFEVLTAENEYLKQKQKVLDWQLKCWDEHLLLLKQHGTPTVFGQDDSNASQQPVVDATAALLAKCSPMDEIKRMTPQEFVRRWKTYLKDISGYLLLAENGQADEKIHNKINELVMGASWMAKHMHILNASAMQQALFYNFEEECVQTAEDSHWVRVYQQLKLSSEQKADALALQEMYFSTIHKVLSERDGVLELISNSVKEQDGHVKLDGQADTTDADLLRKLSENLVKQHNACVAVKCGFFTRVLTPLQFARVSLYSFPFFPCALALIALIDQGERGPGANGSRTLSAVR